MKSNWSGVNPPLIQVQERMWLVDASYIVTCCHLQSRSPLNCIPQIHTRQKTLFASCLFPEKRGAKGDSRKRWLSAFSLSLYPCSSVGLPAGHKGGRLGRERGGGSEGMRERWGWGCEDPGQPTSSPLPQHSDALLIYLFIYLFIYSGTGAWTQDLHFEPLHQPFFCDGYFWDRILETICLGWLQTAILLSS
jgi:hypothetical protein